VGLLVSRVEACSRAAAERARRPVAMPMFVSGDVPGAAAGRKLYALSEWPTSLGFFAASAGCRLGMRALQDSIHFPSALVCSPVKATCDARKTGFVAHAVQVVSAAEVGHGRLLREVKEHLPDVATRDLE
jgi:hypothetical protein